MKNLKKVGFICLSLFLVVCFTTGCGNKVESNNTNNNTEGTSFLDKDDSYFFNIDGKKYFAGDKISNVSKSGYKLKDSEKDEVLEAGKYMIWAGHMMGTGTSSPFTITPYNMSKSDLKISDCIIGGISISKVDAKDDSKAMDMSFYGGIKIGSSMDDVKAKFGDASTTSNGTDYTVYRYTSKEVYRNFKIRFDENNLVSAIEWQDLINID